MLHQIISTHNINPTGLSLDSRTIKPGEIFFALQHDYIDHAIKQGACAIICETLPSKKYLIPMTVIENLSQKIGLLAAEFYHFPSHNLQVVGVTGTNGKTSCTHFLAQIFEKLGYNSAVIGTLGTGKIDHLHQTGYTTPDAVMLQKILADFKKEQVQFVFMETSSHGLHQGRINGVSIETGIFTNLTQDHLDYHETLENYARAKYLLFTRPELKNAIFNLDDAYGFKWANELWVSHSNHTKKLNVYGFSLNNIATNVPTVYAKNIQTHSQGMIADIVTPWGEGVLETTLWGKFNLNNILCVLTTLLIYQIPLEKALHYISHLKSVMGRMQIFQVQNKPLVIVDYAHTPDALLKTLQTVKEHCEGKLWCVFGAGGDRDPDKRPLMGRVVEEHADHIILTNDNPRSEDPLKIIHDIRKGFNQQNTVIIELDRRKAIAYAISSAFKADVIVVAGKGHENTQEINHVKIPYSDILTVKMLLLEE